MSPADLKKRIAEVLGVSHTQKDLAFEIFTSKIVEILTEGITLKVPGVGFFRLKESNGKNKFVPQLIFSALSEDLSFESSNSTIVIEVFPKIKNNIEFDSQVFSIGVGKPLLPLIDDEDKNDSETTFILLRKSIEERVKEILTESDQIPNFDLWEDDIDDEDSSADSIPNFSEKLSELTHDLDYLTEEPTGEPGITHEQSLLAALLGEPKFDAVDDFSSDIISEHDTIENNALSEADNLIEDAEFENKFSELESLNVADMLDDSSNNLSINNLEDILNKIEPVNMEQPEVEIENISGIPNEIEPMLENDVTEENKYSAISEIVEDVQSENKEHEIILEPEEVNLVEDIEKIDRFVLPQEDQIPASLEEMVFGSESLEDIESISPLSDFQEENTIIESDDDEDEFEITIQPPTAAKQILIDLIEEEKSLLETESTLKKVLEDDSELVGIISEELKEYDEDKIAKENSQVLNDLLEEVSNRKLQHELEENLEVTEVSEEADETDETQLQEDKIYKIEWNWGDELKSEFGIGENELEEDIEEVDLDADINIPPRLDLNFEIKEEIEPESNDFHYSEEELRKTDHDLFTRLEKTLEHEITILREEYEKPLQPDGEIKEYEDSQITADHFTTPVTVEDSLIESEPELKIESLHDTVTDEKQIEFKDEKVYLDFKTPPPKYEFIAETPEKLEPILERPKRMTILLSPDDLHEPPSVFKNTKVNITEEEEEKPKKKKSSVLPIVSVVSAAFIIIISIVGYFLIRWNYLLPKKDSDSLTSTTLQPNNKNNTTNAANSQSPVVNPSDTLSYSEEFSDFPRTATPPAPIKEGSDYVYLKLPVPQLNANSSVAQKKQPSAEENKVNKVESNDGVFRNLVKDTKVRDMVFFDGKSYSYQTSSWKIKNKAEQEVKRLKSLGLNAFAIEVFLPEKGGTWYRVRVGSFNSEEEALESLRKNNF